MTLRTGVSLAKVEGLDLAISWEYEDENDSFTLTGAIWLMHQGQHVAQLWDFVDNLKGLETIRTHLYEALNAAGEFDD